MKSLISPSLMCADFLHLGDELKKLEENGIEYLHIDIMDGEFVPNYTLGIDFIKKLKAATKIPLDVHMMVTRPENKLDWIITMPGLPKVPAAEKIDVDENGKITGLF